MQVIRNLESQVFSGRPVVGVGVFDGVHQGHMKIIEEVKTHARQRKESAGILTFHPHPARTIDPESAPPVLCSLEHKLCILERTGLDFAVVIDFNLDVARTGAVQFFEEVIVRRMKASCVVVGEDYQFGRGREGNVSLMRKLGQRHGVDVAAMPAVKLDNERVSSSKIRSLIIIGELDAAEKLLGRPYVVAGKIVRGFGRGRSLGFPTANLDPQQEVLPPTGVYVAEAALGDEVHLALASIGVCPTFGEGQDPTVEIHVLGVERDLYDKTFCVRFRQYLRREMKFASAEDLVNQMNKDKSEALLWVEENELTYPHPLPQAFICPD